MRTSPASYLARVLVLWKIHPPSATTPTVQMASATPAPPRRRRPASRTRSRHAKDRPRTQKAWATISSATVNRLQYAANHAQPSMKWPKPFMSEYGVRGMPAKSYRLCSKCITLATSWNTIKRITSR